MSLSDDDDDDMVTEYWPTATCSIQGSLTLGLEEAVEENHHPMQGHW